MLTNDQWASRYFTPDGQPLLSAAAHVRAMAEGRITAAKLTEDALERASDKRGEGARVFTQVHTEWAMLLAQASHAVRTAGAMRSPAEGVPVSIKDLFDVAGWPTCAGSAVLRKAAAARQHASVVQRLLAAGTVLIGRTNMTEFAYSGLGLNPHYGTPANPWQRAQRRIPGGSSSGAAVAVADGMCAASIGSDTGGSVRIPAALCGLTGFKPTARRVPQDGVLPLSRALDSIGVIAHDVRSCILLDAVIADAPVALHPRDLKQAHFAVPQTVVFDGVQDAVAQAFNAALEVLRQCGAQITPVDIPEFAQLAEINAGGGFTAAEAWAWHADLLQKREAEYDPRVASRIRRGEGFLAKDFIQLQQQRSQWQQAVHNRIHPFDAMLMPTVAHIAPRIADLQSSDEAYFAANAAMLRNPSLINFLDGCAISLPCHQTGQAPVGLSVAGSAMQDEAVAQWALAIETALQKSGTTLYRS